LVGLIVIFGVVFISVQLLLTLEAAETERGQNNVRIVERTSESRLPDDPFFPPPDDAFVPPPAPSRPRPAPAPRKEVTVTPARRDFASDVATALRLHLHIVGVCVAALISAALLTFCVSMCRIDSRKDFPRTRTITGY